METIKIRTLVKSEWKTLKGKTLKTNDYMRGRISAINQFLSEGEIPYAIKNDSKSGIAIFVGDFTEENYVKFQKTIEDWYPGLCIFNYEESK